MKKRLLSLLVALCMAVTLLPVSAITAWAEESSSNSTTLRIKYGYPVGSIDANGTHTTSCFGDGWSYDGTTLDLHPDSPTEYDFFHFLVMETLWIALLKSGQRQQLQEALSPMI